MPPSLTSDEFKKGLAGLADGLRESMKENTRDLVRHFTTAHHDHTKRFDRIDERFDQVDAKLEAIIEMLAMRKEMHNLVRELRGQGVTLDESKIFIA